MTKRKVILFNGRWQAYENTQVMVSNRNGKDCQIFCRASEVQIGDNVWEHNIVETIEVLDELMDNIKEHYGPIL
jgi:hypothetical protein